MAQDQNWNFQLSYFCKERHRTQNLLSSSMLLYLFVCLFNRHVCHVADFVSHYGLQIAGRSQIAG